MEVTGKITSSSKDLAKHKLRDLVEKFKQSTKSHHTEQDTIRIFILPLLELLGWNIYDVYEVRQGSFPYHLTKSIAVNYRLPKHPDCVVSFDGVPRIVLECKKLAYGLIDKYCQNVVGLLDETDYAKAKFAVLTSFAETIVYDGTKIVYEENSNILYDGIEVYNALTKKYDCTRIEPLISFRNPTEYLSKFDVLWADLSKESGKE